MKIGIICGSQRSRSQTAKVGLFIQQQLIAQQIETFMLDLGETPMTVFGMSLKVHFNKNGSLFHQSYKVVNV